jgi:hypothetical protein
MFSHFKRSLVTLIKGAKLKILYWLKMMNPEETRKGNAVTAGFHYYFPLLNAMQRYRIK